MDSYVLGFVQFHLKGQSSHVAKTVFVDIYIRSLIYMASNTK